MIQDAPVTDANPADTIATRFGHIPIADQRFIQLLLPQLLVSAAAITLFAFWFDLPGTFACLHVEVIATVESLFFLICGVLVRRRSGGRRSGMVLGYASAVFWMCAGINLLYLGSLATNAAWGSNLSFANLRYAGPHLRGFRETFGVSVYAAAAVLAAALLAAWWLTGRAGGWLLDRLERAFPPRRSLRLPVLATVMFAVLVLQSWSSQREPGAFARADPIVSFYLNPEPVTPGAAADEAARRSYPPVTSFRRRNVLVFTLDSARADHAGVCGYARETTPFLSRLERDGHLRRVPSGISVANHSAGGIFAVLGSIYVERQSPTNFTLCDVLRQAGYHTYLIGSGDHTGFDDMRRCYGTSYQLFSDGTSRSQFSVNDDRGILAALARIPPADDRPAFFFFHLMSSHTLGVHFPEYSRWPPAESLRDRAGRRRSSRADKAIAAYDAGVRQADDFLRQIFELLGEKGYLRDYIGAVTSDHGEAFGEHGHFGHIHRLFTEDIGIPILFLDSETPPALASRFGCQLDIAPTLVERLGLPPAASWQGRSLTRPVGPRTIFLHSKGSRSWRGVLIHEAGRDVKYLFLRRGWEPDQDLLFDLTRDPLEQHNLMPSADVELLARVRGAASAYYQIRLP